VIASLHRGLLVTRKGTLGMLSWGEQRQLHRFVAAKTFVGNCTSENIIEHMAPLFAFCRALDLSLLGSGETCCGLDTGDTITSRVESTQSG
jgi:hypothetical protein